MLADLSEIFLEVVPDGLKNHLGRGLLVDDVIEALFDILGVGIFGKFEPVGDDGVDDLLAERRGHEAPGLLHHIFLGQERLDDRGRHGG